MNVLRTINRSYPQQHLSFGRGDAGGCLSGRVRENPAATFNPERVRYLRIAHLNLQWQGRLALPDSHFVFGYACACHRPPLGEGVRSKWALAAGRLRGFRRGYAPSRASYRYPITGMLVVAAPTTASDVVFLGRHGVCKQLERISVGRTVAFISFACSTGKPRRCSVAPSATEEPSVRLHGPHRVPVAAHLYKFSGARLALRLFFSFWMPPMPCQCYLSRSSLRMKIRRPSGFRSPQSAENESAFFPRGNRRSQDTR